MRVLLLQDQDEVRDRLAFSLESKFNARVIEASDARAGRETLASESPPELIIFDLSSGEPAELKEFWEAARSVPVVLCRSSAKARTAPKENPVLGEVDRANIVEGLEKILSAQVSSGKLALEKPSEGYCRIRTRLLLSMQPLKGDLYIRLSQDHYVKLFALGDVFGGEDLEKYTTRKGVEFLYLRTEDTPEFVQKYNAELGKILNSAPATIEKTISTSAALHETAAALIGSVGFTPEVQKLALANVTLTVRSLGKSPRLNTLLKRLKSVEGTYLNTHSTLVAYVACGLASSLEWVTESTYQKLSLAAFLHDITLKNIEMAELASLDELTGTSTRFTPPEHRDFKFHPLAGAELARQLTNAPPDVDTIILQHHERPDGTGFPRKLTSAQIHPLSSVFIVAHDFVRHMLRNGNISADPVSVQEFVQAHSASYCGAHFKKLMKSLQQ